MLVQGMARDLIGRLPAGIERARARQTLVWSSVGYQHLPNADRTPYPLRAEIGPLDHYLADPEPHTGPDPASLPAEVRDHPQNYLLVALRPSDFNCDTPL